MRKLTAVILVLVLLAVSAAAVAETTISVSGSGAVLVPADTAVISLGVSAADKEVSAAQQKVNEDIAAIRSALTEAGVAPEDINTGWLNIYPMYDYSGPSEMITGYNATSMLSIRLTDLSLAGPVIDLAFGAGANNLNGIDFAASDTEEARNEALRKAVEEARDKAEVLAAAAGLQVKGIRAVLESGTYSYSGNDFRLLDKAAEEADESAETVVQAARLRVEANITIEFTAE
jgi:Uncharacterized conserved protein